MHCAQAVSCAEESEDERKLEKDGQAGKGFQPHSKSDNPAWICSGSCQLNGCVVQSWMERNDVFVGVVCNAVAWTTL